MKDHSEEKHEPTPDGVHSAQYSRLKKSGKSNVPTSEVNFF